MEQADAQFNFVLNQVNNKHLSEMITHFSSFKGSVLKYCDIDTSANFTSKQNLHLVTNWNGFNLADLM